MAHFIPKQGRVTMGNKIVGVHLLFWGLSAPKSRDPLRLRRRFSPLPRRVARFLKAPRCAISSAKKIASERRFSLRFKGPNLTPIAEFPAIPESAAKIASERRCAILVHSVWGNRSWIAVAVVAPPKSITVKVKAPGGIPSELIGHRR